MKPERIANKEMVVGLMKAKGLLEGHDQDRATFDSLCDDIRKAKAILADARSIADMASRDERFRSVADEALGKAREATKGAKERIERTAIELGINQDALLELLFFIEHKFI